MVEVEEWCDLALWVVCSEGSRVPGAYLDRELLARVLLLFLIIGL